MTFSGAKPTLRGALVMAVVVALVTFAASRLATPFVAFENRARDLVHAMAYPAQATRDDIAIVLIDEITLAKFPYRSPIDRGFLAELIGTLRTLGARAIAIDLLIDQPTEQVKDFALLDAVEDREGAPVILAVADEDDGLTRAQADWLAAASEFALTGQAALLRDPYDFVTRGVSATRKIRDRATPGFAVAMARAGGLTTPDEGFDIAFTPSRAGEDFAPRLIAGFHAQFTEDAIRDRFVFVGVDLDGIDRHRTPLEVATDQPDSPGVESHAQALAQIIDGRELRETGLAAELLIAVTAAILTVAVLFWSSSVSLRLALWLGVLVAFAAWPALALGVASVRMPVIPPLLAGLTAGGLLTLARWRAEALTRRRLRDAFGRYVSPEVVRDIESKPDALALGGEKREVTCVFTDVAGFTGLCEALPADKLVELLNRYLGGASNIFVDYGGTIDKFVGDAIVGFFGAPLAVDNHAASAIRMAVALDAFAVGFVVEAAREGHKFGVTRIGVHTGQATVGNFGGDVFFDYTAMGDTVNVAARLEGANKAYGGRMTVSGDALAAAGGSVEGVLTRPIGRLRVKGRDAPLATHEAFAPDDPRAATLNDYIAAYTLLESDGDAGPAFQKLAAAAPDDGLVAFHAARCAEGETGAVVTLKEK